MCFSLRDCCLVMWPFLVPVLVSTIPSLRQAPIEDAVLFGTIERPYNASTTNADKHGGVYAGRYTALECNTYTDGVSCCLCRR